MNRTTDSRSALVAPSASATRNSSAASKPLIVPDVTGLDDFEAAHIYLDDGFTPVPWIPARKEKILHPAVMTGAVLNEWVATHAGIERWPDESRCGLLTSRASGVIAVDIDDRARFRAWLAENGYGDMFAVDAWSSTGRPGGGSHLLYDARAIANGSSNWPMQGKVTEAGFDLKSNGFIGAEPSLHPTGVPYLWHGETYRIRPIGGLADLLCKLRGTAGNSPRAEYDSTVQDWLDDYGAGDMCRYIRSVARNTAEAITGDAHGAIERISAIVRGTGEGHTGAASALQEIEAAFRAEARKRAHRARSGTAIDGEWNRMLASKVAQYGTDDVAESDPCDESHDVLADVKPIVNGKQQNSASSKNGRNLPGEFYDDMPELGHIRQAAYSRGRSADAVVGVVLARISAFAPVSLVFDAGLGPSPITLFCVLCGIPDSGKSVSIQAGIDLLPESQFGMDGTFAGDLPLGSGEGIPEAYYATMTERDGNSKTRQVRRKLYDQAFFHEDEGQKLVKTMAKGGNIIAETIRSAWSGTQLGQTRFRE